MINIVYLILIIVGSEGVTSQMVPQANMTQCQANARIFNEGVKNKNFVVNGYGSNGITQKALCLVGVK